MGFPKGKTGWRNASWTALERQALWRLDHADELSPQDTLRGLGRVLRAWRYTLAWEYVSWNVMAPLPNRLNEARPLVREVVWHKAIDRRRLDDPVQSLKRHPDLEPSLRVRDAEVAPEHLNPLLAAAGSLSLPASDPASTAGGDVVFGVEGFRSRAYFRKEWMGTGPDEWKDLIAWVARLRDLLVRALDERQA